MEKNYFKIIIVFVLFWLIFLGRLNAITFEEFGIRPQGMGFAFTGVANDLNSLLYNPAGLADIGVQFSFGFYDLNKVEWAEKEGWIFSGGNFAYGQFLLREKDDNLYRCYAFGGGFKLNEYGNVGFVWKKYDFSSLEESNSFIDFGYLKEEILPKVNLGILLTNVFKEKREKIELPIGLRIGVSYFYEQNNRLIVDLETQLSSLRELSSYKLFYGLETNSNDSVKYRLGWSQKGFSFGFSWTIPYLVIEYSLLKLTEGAEIVHSVGFKLTAK